VMQALYDKQPRAIKRLLYGIYIFIRREKRKHLQGVDFVFLIFLF